MKDVLDSLKYVKKSCTVFFLRFLLNKAHVERCAVGIDSLILRLKSREVMIILDGFDGRNMSVVSLIYNELCCRGCASHHKGLYMLY